MKSRIAFLLPLLAACAGACSDDSRPASASDVYAADAPSGFGGIANLSFDFYDVSGRNGAEVRRSIDARRPYDGNFGRRVDALTSWGIDWNIPVVNGRCDLDGAEVRYRARVQLPRLRDEEALPEPDRSRWRAFRAWLEEHEAWHARHAWDHVRDVRAAIRSSSCANAEAAAAAAIRRIAQQQLDYDVATRHGENGGVSFP